MSIFLPFSLPTLVPDQPHPNQAGWKAGTGQGPQFPRRDHTEMPPMPREQPNPFLSPLWQLERMKRVLPSSKPSCSPQLGMCNRSRNGLRGSSLHDASPSSLPVRGKGVKPQEFGVNPKTGRCSGDPRHISSTSVACTQCSLLPQLHSWVKGRGNISPGGSIAPRAAKVTCPPGWKCSNAPMACAVPAASNVTSKSTGSE